MSTIDFKYRRFNGRNNYLPAMHTIEHIVETAQLTTGDGFATVWGRIYGNWVTDEVCFSLDFSEFILHGPWYGVSQILCVFQVIDTEVSRNIMLALGCVMCCTTILILNPNICFWIFMCVVLTLVRFNLMSNV